MMLMQISRVNKSLGLDSGLDGVDREQIWMAELSDKHREAGLKKGWRSRGKGRLVAGQGKAKSVVWDQTMDQSVVHSPR